MISKEDFLDFVGLQDNDTYIRWHGWGYFEMYNIKTTGTIQFLVTQLQEVHHIKRTS